MLLLCKIFFQQNDRHRAPAALHLQLNMAVVCYLCFLYIDVHDNISVMSCVELSVLKVPSSVHAVLQFRSIFVGTTSVVGSSQWLHSAYVCFKFFAEANSVETYRCVHLNLFFRSEVHIRWTAFDLL